MSIQFAGAESLWDEDFSGYGIGGKRLEAGRILTVIIDSDTNMSFSSARSADRELVLSFSGGDTGDLFSFLPEIQSVDRGSMEGEEDFSLNTSVAVRVQETSAVGMSFVQGSRTTRVNGGVHAITVSGWVDPRSLSEDGSIPFDMLADGTLTYRTFLDDGGEILREEDITEAVAAAETAAADTGTAEETAGEDTAVETEEEAAGAETSTEGAAAAEAAPPEIRITDERKRELLLQYINSFLRIIFSE